MFSRDLLGRMVREAWIKWAQTQPNPKPHWLLPYYELSEVDKEADRQIGEHIQSLVLDSYAARDTQHAIIYDGMGGRIGDITVNVSQAMLEEVKALKALNTRLVEAGRAVVSNARVPGYDYCLIDLGVVNELSAVIAEYEAAGRVSK